MRRDHSIFLRKVAAYQPFDGVFWIASGVTRYTEVKLFGATLTKNA
jgi:hypothetical protein